MNLDLTALENATNSLENAIKEYEKENNEFVRDACIQRFEYTYELSWKTIKRYLELVSPNPGEIDLLSFQELIREANERDLLLNDWETWKLYRIYRGTTSHAYNEKKANEIYAEIPAFLAEIQHLIKQLQKHLN